MHKYKQKIVSFVYCVFQLIAISSVIGYIFLISGCKQNTFNIDVSATKVLFFSAFTKEITTEFNFMGHTEPNKTVNIVPRISGTLNKINFTEGKNVKQGELLFEIDPTPYQIVLDQAKANLSEKLSNSVLATKEYERALDLYRSGNLSESKFDLSTSKKDGSNAAVKVAKEEVKKAKLNVSYAKIKAPFDGIISESKYSSGNLISPESGYLTTLVDSKIIDVRFYIKERQVLEFLEAKNSVSDLTDNLNIDLLDPSTDKIILQQGKLVYLSPTIDKMSAMLTAKVKFINNYIVVPGLYVKLIISKKETVSKIVVPKSCVLESQLGKYVWIVNSQNKVEKCYIKVERSKGNFYIVEDGLIANDKIIIEGIQKVYQDADVSPYGVTIDQDTASIISSNIGQQ